MNAEYQAVPMTTINTPEGKPYISVIDNDETVRFQLHRYDEDYPSRIYVNIDKKALPELIRALEKLESF